MSAPGRIGEFRSGRTAVEDVIEATETDTQAVSGGEAPGAECMGGISGDDLR